VEAADAGARRALGERRQQGRAYAVALPAVDHLDRDLGGIELLKAHVAADPDRRPGRGREGDQRLVMPMVDLDEQAEVPWRQRGLGGEEALIAGLLAEPSEGERDGPAVGGGERANRDIWHLTPLTRPASRM
jgi:hypothetical protein